MRDVDAAMRRALICTLDGDLDAAEALLNDVVRSDTEAVDAYLALARLYRQRGDVGRAIHLHQNLLLRTDLAQAANFDALLGLADDFRAGGFLRRAIAAYEEVLAAQPQHAGALRALVGLLGDVRESRKAIPLARRLAKIEGREAGLAEARLWVDVAEAERGEGRSDEARKALAKSLRRDKTLAPAWIALGQVEAELGRPRKALAAWRRVPELDRSAGPRVYPKLAATFAAVGRARDYEAFLRKLLEEQPDDPAARVALAQALAARGAQDESLAEVDRVLQSDPDQLDAHAIRARLLLAEGQEPELRKALEALLDGLERRRVTWTGDSLE